MSYFISYTSSSSLPQSSLPASITHRLLGGAGSRSACGSASACGAGHGGCILMGTLGEHWSRRNMNTPQTWFPSPHSGL